MHQKGAKSTKKMHLRVRPCVRLCVRLLNKVYGMRRKFLWQTPVFFLTEEKLKKVKQC